MVEQEGFETVIGAVYRSSSKPFVKADLDTLIGLSKSKIFIFGVTSIPNTRIGILGYLHRVDNYCQGMQIGISMQSPHRIVLLTIRIGRIRTLTYWISLYINRSYL
jgi:hypothetical protein